MSSLQDSSGSYLAVCRRVQTLAECLCLNRRPLGKQYECGDLTIFEVSNPGGALSVVGVSNFNFADARPRRSSPTFWVYFPGSSVSSGSFARLGIPLSAFGLAGRGGIIWVFVGASLGSSLPSSSHTRPLILRTVHRIRVRSGFANFGGGFSALASLLLSSRYRGGYSLAGAALSLTGVADLDSFHRS